MNNLSARMLPTALWGKLSIGLAIAMPILFLIGASFTNTLYESVPSGDTILADISSRPALALTMLAGMLAGISAFITGIIGISRNKDRAILVYVSTAVGALLCIYLLAEILFPH